jgi:hypothetical protein
VRYRTLRQAGKDLRDEDRLGQYAGLTDCNPRTKVIFVPKDEGAAQDTATT